MRTATALGAFLPLALTQFAFAPGAGAAVDPRDNDYGQTPDQISAEIATQADETPAVVAALRTFNTAQQNVANHRAAQAKAKRALAKAKKMTGPNRKAVVARAKARLKNSTASLVTATTAAGQAQSALASARAIARENATEGHFVPVDGTWTGGTVWYHVEGQTDPIQVQIVVTNGHVSAVDVPLYVNTGDTGAFNHLALPILKQEALAALDTANVATVSSASLTSDAFRGSLQSALIQAGFPL
jgi:uncharacterized protein with FMN-binding domain